MVEASRETARYFQDHPYLVSEDVLRIVQNEVSGERAWDMMSKISRFHRIRGGGEGTEYNKCVNWLAEELRRIGVEDVKIEKYRSDGFKGYYLWRSPVGWRIKEAELWLLEPEKKLFTRFSDQALSVMEYSNGGEVESEVINVGRGTSDADYEGKDVKGKLVFATAGAGSLGTSPGYEVHRQAVLKRGAAGVIVGPSGREDRLRYADMLEDSRLSPKREERKQTGFGFAISRRQEKELLSYFTAGKRVRMRAKVEAELFDGEMPVLEATIIGTEHPDQEILIMGHLDHYKPGANDNASGSAGMFEMIRNILALVHRKDIPPLRRTLRFLWLPELHGAVAYTTEHPELREKGIAGMNLDMIGEDFAACESTFNLTCAPYSVPNYINDVLANLLPWLEDNAFYSPQGTRYRFNYRITPASGGSDHIAFNDSVLSIPTLMLGHGDVFHHTSLDTPDKCDPTEMKRIVSLAEAASLLLANADDDDALGIAREVYSNAALRMAERTRKSLRLLQQNLSNTDTRQKTGELYSNILKYPQIQTQVESANLREIKELCKEDATKAAIDHLSRDLDQQCVHEQQKISSTYGLLLALYDLKKDQMNPTPVDTEKSASTLKPVRLFKGPFTMEYLTERVDEKSLKWYQEYRGAVGPYDAKTLEMPNLMDGKHTLLEIRDLISCEYDETSLEFVIHFARDLEKIGLVDLLS